MPSTAIPKAQMDRWLRDAGFGELEPVRQPYLARYSYDDQIDMYNHGLVHSYLIGKNPTDIWVDDPEPEPVKIKKPNHRPPRPYGRNHRRKGPP